MRLIDVDAKELRQRININFGGVTRFAIKCILKDAPTIDAVPVKHGRWVDHFVRDWRCSECGEKIHKVRHVDGYCFDDKPNYCPNCGAKMAG